MRIAGIGDGILRVRERTHKKGGNNAKAVLHGRNDP